MENFDFLNLPETLSRSLAFMKFTTPTPIQAQAIPPALEGKDILGSAQTGTGKTGAFGIPLVAHLLHNEDAVGVIMTPTRELAVQVMQMMRALLGPKSGIKSALLIGGEPIGKQFSQLRQKPRLIVGTPGRITDHLDRKTLSLQKANFLVLDETDRMLDMGFTIQIEKILTFIPEIRQTLLFSATLPKNINKLAARYLKDPVRISAGSTVAPAAKIKQDVVKVNEAKKYDTLLDELNAREGSIIVFVKTKRSCDKIAARLRNDDHAAEAIHGDLRQNKRDRVIRAFRNKKYRILVATDVAARGLDIPHIEHVINYDLPQCPEDYIHRIGRTARAGAEGSALCLLGSSDKGKWAAIQRLIDPNAKSTHSGDQKPSSFKGKRKPFRGKKPHGRSFSGVKKDRRSGSDPVAAKGRRPKNKKSGGLTRQRSAPAA